MISYLYKNSSEKKEFHERVKTENDVNQRVDQFRKSGKAMNVLIYQIDVDKFSRNEELIDFFDFIKN